MTRETLYRKKPSGRYEIMGESELMDRIIMPPQGFVLTHRAAGATQWEYAVQPDTAGFMAAAMVARQAMEDAIRDAATYHTQAVRPYTKKQLACIEQFKRDMGMVHPYWWTQTSARDIAQAAIDAVRGAA